MVGFTLDPVSGLNTPRLVEARELVVEKWKAAHGDNVNTSSDTPDGQIIDVLAIVLATLWEANLDVYSASYFRTASGTALDLILDLFGKQRLAESFSTASLVWYGTAASSIPESTAATVNDLDESRFETDIIGEVGAAGSSVVWVVRILQAVDTETHTILVDGASYPYVNTGIDTVDSVAVALRDLVNADTKATATLAGNDSSGNALIVLDSLVGATLVTVIETTAGMLDEFEAGRIASTSTNPGPVSGVAGTIQTLPTIPSGIEGVTNSSDATLGRFEETNAEYRKRHLLTLNAEGCGTPQAIRDRVLKNVTVVTQARVFENETDQVDAAGRPPHSFELVALYADGLDPSVEIAAEIAACKPAAIRAFGSIVVAVPDPQGGGGTVDIGFSPPLKRYLHLTIDVTKGEGFPTTGDPDEAIRTAVALYLGEGGDGFLNMGTDLDRFQLATPINEAVAGIKGALIETDDTPAPGDVPTLTPADIVVAEDEILISDASRIVVVIL